MGDKRSHPKRLNIQKQNSQINYPMKAWCSFFPFHGGAGEDVVFLRVHLEEIRVQPDTAAPLKHDSGMNGGF